MQRLKAVIRLAARNGRSFAGFEAVYKMTAVVVFFPLLMGAFSLATELSGYAYLTHENLRAFLAEPATVLAAAVLLLLGAAFALVDICAVAFTLDRSARGVKISSGQILRGALKSARRMLRRENILLAPAALLLLPFVNVALASGILATVSLPAAVGRFLGAHPALPLGLAGAGALMTALGMRWRYAVFCFIAEDRAFPQARRRSAALGRGRCMRDLLTLVLTQAAFFIVYLLLLALVMGLAGLLGRSFSGIFLLKWLTSSAVWLALVLTLAVIAALAVPVGYGSVGVMYYRRRAEAGESAPQAPAPGPGGDGRVRLWSRLLRIGAVCAVTAGSLTLGLLLSTGRINPDIEYLHTTEITAHRGASALFPENTMAAFAGARDMGADWIELDVQQSRDGRLIVAHDANLKRTTGVNAYVWDLTYEQIGALDAGSAFGPDFAGERIPLLEDVLAFAKDNGLRLNIELKPTGHETDLEKAVVNALWQADLADSCVITSQVYGVLERVKDYDETITTVYVMKFAYGSIDRLDAADDFSVEASSVTSALISRVHNAGKGLYVWTVNDRRTIARMIEMGVDNIITDNIDLAKQCVYESRYSDLLEDYYQDLLQ